MKFNKILLTLAAVAALTIPTAARAQSDAVDSTSSLIIATPGPWATVAGVNSVTNGPVDLLGFSGRGALYLMTSTNAGGTLTAQAYTSPDSTNWTALANYMVINSTTSRSITNSYPTGVNTNLVVTDNYLLPYSVATPTASSAGFNAPYEVYNAWTNTGAVTVTAAGVYVVGINLTDSPRYLRVVWTGTGAATNGSTILGAFLTGKRYLP